MDPVKYQGLQNQGATCYLNSVLQVLFMTEDFREAVKRHSSIRESTDHIDKELSYLFCLLEEKHITTKIITNKLRIHNVYEQRDAAECYEKILRLTSDEASKIFHGELRNWNRCQDCGNITENVTGFWHLPLPLVNNDSGYSVERGIEDFFHPSFITGDDQMYCEKCDRKCDALLGCEVKCHPEVLVLLLKRFEMIYDGYSVRKVKINCDVKMPDTLNMAEVGKRPYKLYAYVEHFGDLTCGHYIANIKSPNGLWYIFDDLNIKEADYQHFQLDDSEMSRNVYLLFYQQQKGDSSPTNIAQPDTRVTNGAKDTHHCIEEEGENTTTRATHIVSAFNMSEEKKSKQQKIENKKLDSSQNKEKKHILSGSVFQSQTDPVIVPVLDNAHEEIREGNRQKRKNFEQSEHPSVENKKKGSSSPSSACDRKVLDHKSQMHFSPPQTDFGSQLEPRRESPNAKRYGVRNENMNRPGFGEGRRKMEKACGRSDHDARNQKMQESEGIGPAKMYHQTGRDQERQKQNTRSPMESSDRQREKDGHYNKNNVAINSKNKNAHFSQQPENFPLPRTPQRCLETAQQKAVRSTRKNMPLCLSQSRPKDSNVMGIEKDAADVEFEAKAKQKNKETIKPHRHGSRERKQLEREKTQLEKGTSLNTTKKTDDSLYLTVPDRNVPKKKKSKKLFCFCLPFRKRSK